MRGWLTALCVLTAAGSAAADGGTPTAGTPAEPATPVSNVARARELAQVLKDIERLELRGHLLSIQQSSIVALKSELDALPPPAGSAEAAARLVARMTREIERGKAPAPPAARRTDAPDPRYPRSSRPDRLARSAVPPRL